MGDEPKSPLGETTPANKPIDLRETADSVGISDEDTTATEDTDAAKTVESSHGPSWQRNAEDSKQETATEPRKFRRLRKFGRAYWSRKKWAIPLTLVIVAALLLAIPFTRYPILGTVLKKDASVVVVDSVTDQPVTDASVLADGKTYKTDNHGRAVMHLKVGKHDVSITKKYYKSSNATLFVSVTKLPSISVKAVATGRQVPISVTDYITGQPLENAVITASGSSTKTDKQGNAVLVLPVKGENAKATITRTSYNDSSVSVLITSREVTTNKFAITPTGKVYFLSNLSGKIDVVKTDLDGKNRKTVFAGTGTEDTNSTALLASRDWKYLALLSKRDGKQGIYLIDTASDKATNIDGGNNTAGFTLVGWSGTTFVYQVQRSNVQNWQVGAQVIKSYDAVSGKLFTLDQSLGEGSSTSDYGYTTYSNIALLDGEVVFAKNWYSSSFPDHLTGKSSSLISVHSDGTAKKSIKDFAIPAGTPYGYSINTLQYEPYGLYLQVPNGTDGTSVYYAYEKGSVAQKSDVTDDTWNKAYPTFLISPSGKSTFWSEVRDNKNFLFVGNGEGGSGKQIATLSDFTPYGWYTDNYLLVSKNGSELYVMPADGSKDPSKMTDYYKPQLTYRGYGGGYGGL